MIPNQRFLFLRHGQTDWNLEGRFQGLSDIPLNDTGVSQAVQAASRLQNTRIDRVVSSPLIRALKTAAVVADRLALPVHVDSALHERSFGSFEGEIIADVKRAHGLPTSEPARKILPADAEAWPQTLERSRTAFGAWLADRPSEEVTLFVAHHGLFRALSELLVGGGLESGHAVPYEFVPPQERQAWSVAEIGQ